MLRYLTFNKNTCPICNYQMRFSLAERHHLDGCTDDVGTFMQQEPHNAQNNPHAGLIGRSQYACAHWIAGHRTGPRISAPCDPLPPRRSWRQIFPLVLTRASRPSSMILVEAMRW